MASERAVLSLDQTRKMSFGQWHGQVVEVTDEENDAGQRRVIGQLDGIAASFFAFPDEIKEQP